MGARRLLALGAGPEASLAFKLSTANRRRAAVTLAGASLAVSLIIYQMFLIVGFVASAGALIRSVDADLWVLAHEAQAFDFSAPLRRDLAFGIAGIAGVADTEPVVSGFANAVDARGRPAVVALAGVPVERFRPDAGDHARRAASAPGHRSFAFVDRTALDQFAVRATPFTLEISGERVAITQALDGYATFLGSPFVVTSAENAVRWLRFGRGDCTGIAVWLQDGVSVDRARRAIATAYPELMVLSTREYALRSALFWLTKTGAGGGLLLSAVLGFGIGMLIISQNLYASVLESIQHYATLRAIGFESSTLRNVVIAQSTALALVAGVIGSALAYLLAGMTRLFVLGWIAQPAAVPLVVLAGCAGMGLIASFSAVRLIHGLEPAHALRQ